MSNDYIPNKHHRHDTLIISGGGSSGIAMLGSLYSYLYHNRCIDLNQIETFSGTSIGATIAFLLSIGFTPIELAGWIFETKLWEKFVVFDIFRLVNGRGAFSLALLQEELEKMILVKLNFLPTFSDLEKNFMCVSFDYDRKNLVYFSNKTTPTMNVIDAIIASCAIPYMFAPYLINGFVHIDGGILDNFPIEKTIQLFGSQNILGILKEKSTCAEKDKESWKMAECYGLLFACCNYNTNRQLEKLDTNIKLKILHVKSNVPFYNLIIDKTMIAEMFISGMTSEKDSDNDNEAEDMIT